MPNTQSEADDTNYDAPIQRQLHLLPVWRDRVNARIRPEIQRSQSDYSWQYVRPLVGTQFWLLHQTLRQLRIEGHNPSDEVTTTIAELAQLAGLSEKTVARLLGSEPIPGQKPWRQLVDTGLATDEIDMRRRLIPRLRYTSSMKPNHARPTRDGFAIEVRMDDVLIPGHERELEDEIAAALGSASSASNGGTLANGQNGSLQSNAKPQNGGLQPDAKPPNGGLQSANEFTSGAPVPESALPGTSPAIAKPQNGDLQSIANTRNGGLQVAKPQLGGATTTTTTSLDRSRSSCSGADLAAWQPPADVGQQLADRFALANCDHWSRAKRPRTEPNAAECTRLIELAQKYHPAACTDSHPGSTDGTAWVLAAINEGIDGGGDQVTISFVSTVLERWQREGFRSSRQEGHQQKTKRAPGQPRARPGPTGPAPSPALVDHRQILEVPHD
ncbi:MAG: hypothetical protein KJ734_01305 [Chloroflexi bacterium]|nr:hypothetical protein [Chloroflexota bacterium]